MGETGGTGKPAVSKMIYYITRATESGASPVVDVIRPAEGELNAATSIIRPQGGTTLLDELLDRTTKLLVTSLLPARPSPPVGQTIDQLIDNRIVAERSPVTTDSRLEDYYSHDLGVTGYGASFKTDPETGLTDYVNRYGGPLYCYGREQVCNPVLLGSQPCVVYGTDDVASYGHWVEPTVRVMQILVPVMIAVAFLCTLAVAAVIFGRRRRETGSALNVYLGGHAVAALCYLLCAGVLHYLTLSGGGVSTEYYARRRADLAIINSVEDVTSSTTITTTTTTVKPAGWARGSWWLSRSAAKLARLDAYFFALSEAFWLIAVYTIIAAGVDRCVRWKRRAAGDSPLSVKRCGSWRVVWTVVAIYVFGLASSLPRIWMAFEPWQRRVQVYGTRVEPGDGPRYFCRMYDWYVILVGFVVPLLGLLVLSSFLLNVICRDRRALRRRLKEQELARIGAEVEGATGGDPRFTAPSQPYILDSDERDPMVVPVAYTPSATSSRNVEGGLGTVITPLRRPPPPPAYYPYGHYPGGSGGGERDALVYGNQLPPPLPPPPPTGYGQAYNYNHNNSNEQRHGSPYDDDELLDDYEAGTNHPAAGSTAYYDVSGERGILRESGKRALNRGFWSRARTTFALAAATFLTPLLFGPFAFSQVWINRIQDVGPTLGSVALSQIFQAAIYLYFVLHAAILLCFYDRFRRGAASLCCRCSKAGPPGRTISAEDGRPQALEGSGPVKGSEKGKGSKVESTSKTGSGRFPCFGGSKDQRKASGGSKKEPPYRRAAEREEDREDADFVKPARPVTPMTGSMLSGAAADQDRDRGHSPVVQYQAGGTKARDTTVILTPGSSLRGTGVLTKMLSPGQLEESFDGRREDGGGGGTTTFRPESGRTTTQLLVQKSPPVSGGAGHRSETDVKLLDGERGKEGLWQVEEAEKEGGGGLREKIEPVVFGKEAGLGEEPKGGRKKRNFLPCFGKGGIEDRGSKPKKTGEQGAQDEAALLAAGPNASDDGTAEKEGAIYSSPLIRPDAPSYHPSVTADPPDVVVYRSTTTTLTKVPKGIVAKSYEKQFASTNGATTISKERPRTSLESSADMDDIDDYIDSSGEHTRTDIGDDDYHYGTPLAVNGHGRPASAYSTSASRMAMTPVGGITSNITTFPPTLNRSTAKIRYENIVYNTSSLISAKRYEGDRPQPLYGQPHGRPDPFFFPGSTEASAAAMLKTSPKSRQQATSPTYDAGLYAHLRRDPQAAEQLMSGECHYSSHSGYGH